MSSEYNRYSTAMKPLPILLLVVFLTGCGNTQTLTAMDPPPTVERSAWSVYDRDPSHFWNRVFRQLYRRTTAGGAEYGADELDPLLWLDTTYLLTGESHRQAVQVLDDFLLGHAENLIHDPLKRALFQRDLWAVYDWLASQSELHSEEREALQVRLVEIMKRVALSKEEILSLPDNYRQAVDAGIYPVEFQADRPETAFLPGELFQPGSAWVPMGREGGPIAMTHTEAFPFFGKSVFLVFVRSPDGRNATFDFIDSLNTGPDPLTAIDLEVALVRRMLLIDDRGELVLSPLVETVQIRHFSPGQSFYEFELDRVQLFDDFTGGLVPNDELFMLFMGHGDVFKHSLPKLQASIPEICKACHSADRPVIQTIISYSRHPFSLPDNSRPVLSATTVENESRAVVEWKQDHETWRSLASRWEQMLP